jgi:hypothetical protein
MRALVKIPMRAMRRGEKLEEEEEESSSRKKEGGGGGKIR